MDKMIDIMSFLHLGKFCMFYVHVMYSPCSKFPFIMGSMPSASA